MNRVPGKLLAGARRISAMRSSKTTVRFLLAQVAVVIILLCTALSPSVRAQSVIPASTPPPYPTPKPTPTPKQSDEEVDPDDVISVNTTEILLPVTVRDSAGILVSNL